MINVNTRCATFLNWSTATWPFRLAEALAQIRIQQHRVARERKIPLDPADAAAIIPSLFSLSLWLYSLAARLGSSLFVNRRTLLSPEKAMRKWQRPSRRWMDVNHAMFHRVSWRVPLSHDAFTQLSRLSFRPEQRVRNPVDWLYKTKKERPGRTGRKQIGWPKIGQRRWAVIPHQWQGTRSTLVRSVAFVNQMPPPDMESPSSSCGPLGRRQGEQWMTLHTLHWVAGAAVSAQLPTDFARCVCAGF